MVKQPNFNIPVYEVKPQNGSGRARVLHHNLLLPIPCLPLESQTSPQPTPCQQVSPSAFNQADGKICFSNGDRDSEQSDVESDDRSKEEIVVPKPVIVVLVHTPKKTQDLSVTLQSSLAQLNGSVSVVHLDGGNNSDVSDEVLVSSSSSGSSTGGDRGGVACF